MPHQGLTSSAAPSLLHIDNFSTQKTVLLTTLQNLINTNHLFEVMVQRLRAKAVRGGRRSFLYLGFYLPLLRKKEACGG